ncbi:MAG: hypothetical protein WAQ98_14830 [Blastocatellia bacterium]
MSKNFFSIVAAIIVILLILIGIFYLLSIVFSWSVTAPSPKTMLDIASGAICLLWLLFILKVPWDLYFKTHKVLFEMKRSEEKNIAVKEDRRRYVKKMRWITGSIAIGSHVVSASLIATLTYWNSGQIGYYFAFFYVLATFFRPATQAYFYLLNKLREIQGEILYPREDVGTLRSELNYLIGRVDNLEKYLEDNKNRLTATEETSKNLSAEIKDLNYALERVDKNFQNRLQLLTTEVERGLSKAFDQQDVVSGLRAFARLIKQA